MILFAASFEVVHVILECLDIEMLFVLQMVSREAYQSLRGIIEHRCKRECFSPLYIYSTIATYRMMANVPKTWKELYCTFSSLQQMSWKSCEQKDASSSLRLLKSDNNEYRVDRHYRFLLRSGGHYWFSVFQTSWNGITIQKEQKHPPVTTANEKERGLAFLKPSLIIQTEKWEKIRAVGNAPCPRRQHTMTCLNDVYCSQSHLLSEQKAEVGSNHGRVRRVLFFGGQSEGLPFQAFNDLWLLLIDRADATARVFSTKVSARWIHLTTSGQPPSPRCGHDATLLSPESLLISGGSDGTTPLPRLDIYLLHIICDSAFGQFRWSTVVTTNTPSGRSMHSVYRVNKDEVFVYGGRQIRQSNGLTDVKRLHITTDEHDEAIGQWSDCELHGEVPHERRGHSTTIIGSQLLLIGGQDASESGQLYGDVRVLNVVTLCWSTPRILGIPPCPRRGFKSQYFGTSLVISSGFVLNQTSGKVNQQLPENDIHLLSLHHEQGTL